MTPSKGSADRTLTADAADRALSSESDTRVVAIMNFYTRSRPELTRPPELNRHQYGPAADAPRQGPEDGIYPAPAPEGASQRAVGHSRPARPCSRLPGPT